MRRAQKLTSEMTPPRLRQVRMQTGDEECSTVTWRKVMFRMPPLVLLPVTKVIIVRSDTSGGCRRSELGSSQTSWDRQMVPGWWRPVWQGKYRW